MQTSLQGIAEKAKREKKYRFRNLYGMLNEEYLIRCWGDIRKEAAYGVDRVSAQEYQGNLVGNIRDLVGRLKRKSYRAKLVRRHYIPKGNGKLRPLGIPAVEDKLLQLAVARLLEAIYEQDFLRCSYGYRPARGPLDAVDKLTVKLQFGRYEYVVEADIKGFFDNIDHDWMIRMLAERVEDKALLWLIKKWLKAGVLDTDGKVLHPITGTPQGGIISPVLSNVYLHYALDLWFEKIVKKHCKGEACLIRFADDFVCGFERQEEAEAFYKVLPARLGKFGLQLSMDKTRVIRFHRQESKESFDFLGFEFRWGKDRSGKAHLKRHTSRKKLRSSLKRFTAWCKEVRNWKVRDLCRLLCVKLRGYYNYYGVTSNGSGLNEFYGRAIRILHKWLNRRSQKTSFTWETFKELLKRYRIPQPRLVVRSRARQSIFSI
jgi:RNA-directed DNA polymerase